MATLNEAKIREVFGELADEPRWVAWQEEKQGTGEPRKMPKNPRTGGNAITTWGRKVSKQEAARTWGTLQEALERCERDGLDGVGIVLGGGLGGVDLDACRDPETGELTTWARRWVEKFGSYTEVSPSHTGLKTLAFSAPPGELPADEIRMNTPAINGKRAAVEVFNGRRFFAVTLEPLECEDLEVPAEIRENPEAWKYAVQELEQHGTRGAERERATDVEVTGNTHISAGLWKALAEDPDINRVWETGKGDGTDKSRNDASLATHLVQSNFPNREIEAALRKYPLGQVGSGKYEGEVADRAIKRCIALARGERKERTRAGEAVNRDPLSVEDLVAAGQRPQEFVANPIMPKGSRGLWVGVPGTAKTTNVVQSGVQLAAGQNLFGHFEVERPHRVLCLLAQDGARPIGHRLVNMLRGWELEPTDLGDRLRTFCRPNLRLTDRSDMAWLRGQIEEHGSEVLLIDSYKYVRTGSESDNADADDNLRALSKLQDQTGVTLVLVHHARKPGEADWSVREIFTTLGAQSFPAWTTAMLHFSTREFGAPIEVVTELWDVVEQVGSFKLHWEKERIEGEWAVRLVHEQESDVFEGGYDLSEAQERAVEEIRKMLVKHGPDSVSFYTGKSNRKGGPKGWSEALEKALDHLEETRDVYVDREYRYDGRQHTVMWFREAMERGYVNGSDLQSDAFEDTATVGGPS